eukprot:SAG25_NODE_9189_length_383_cov_1.281690_1_plen_35_part_01
MRIAAHVRGTTSGATKTVATNDYGANVCDDCQRRA